MNIEKIDKNFNVAIANDTEFNYYNPRHAPFVLEGFPFVKKDTAPYCRLPLESLSSLSEGLQALAYHTAGGQIRFCTDSTAIAIKATIGEKSGMNHMPASGQSSFDCYCGIGKDKKFIGISRPSVDQTSYNNIIPVSTTPEIHEITINFPLYNSVKEVLIGLHPGAKILFPTPHAVEKPVLFYGSSITQGGCASRPGNAYCQIITRWLDAPCINLGFSGNAKGEPEMAEIMNLLNLSAFVMDYDHNTPTAEYLQHTHEPFFKIIRAKNPNLPIILVSASPQLSTTANGIHRKNIIMETYLNAIHAGDKNTYFIDGNTIFGTSEQDSCTMDGTHPNDLGFMRMAEHIYPIILQAMHK